MVSHSGLAQTGGWQGVSRLAACVVLQMSEVVRSRPFRRLSDVSYNNPMPFSRLGRASNCQKSATVSEARRQSEAPAEPIW